MNNFLKITDCGAEFTARSTLYVHAKRHNVDSASATFPCDYPGCNKQYSGKSNLRKHVVRCHGSRIKSTPNKPAESAKAVAEPQQTDYIAVFLGDDEDQSALSGRLTFLAVPAESLQVCRYSLFRVETILKAGPNRFHYVCFYF